MSEAGRDGAVCPRCGAATEAGAARCPSCGGPLVSGSPPANPYAPPKAPLAAGRTTALGRLGRVASYLVGVVLILLSGVIAFVATCFPIGWASLAFDFPVGLFLACLVGLVPAGAALVFSTRLFKRVMSPKGEETP